jgi:endonuclease YncB( thermonuclease family)
MASTDRGRWRSPSPDSSKAAATPVAVTRTEPSAQRQNVERRLAYALHPVSVMPARLLLHAVLAAILGLGTVAPIHAQTLSGRVVGIADGDTLTILDTSNQQHRIRLNGIDAPEKKQPFGSRSKQNLAALAFAKHAVVEWTKPDRYERIVGKMIVDGQEQIAPSRVRKSSDPADSVRGHTSGYDARPASI